VKNINYFNFAWLLTNVGQGTEWGTDWLTPSSDSVLLACRQHHAELRTLLFRSLLAPRHTEKKGIQSGIGPLSFCRSRSGRRKISGRTTWKPFFSYEISY